MEAIAESSPTPLRPEAAPPALLAWVGDANATTGAARSGVGSNSSEAEHGTALLQGCLVVSLQGGPHTLYRASPVAGVRALGPELRFSSRLTI